MQTTIKTVIEFGRDGNASEFQISGWYDAEDKHTWVSGDRSSLRVDAPVAPFGYFIEIDWDPILRPPFLSGQTVIIDVNGYRLKTFQVTGGGMVAFRCPPPTANEPQLTITFFHPDAIKPSDFTESRDNRELSLLFRRLRILVLAEPWREAFQKESSIVIKSLDAAAMTLEAEKMTGRGLKELLDNFELLAGNCDMGLALRTLNYESLSLLRFAGATPQVADKGLETDFDGLGIDIDAKAADNPIKEWMISDQFGLRFHSGQSSDIVTKDDVLRKFKPYAKVLVRKIVEDLNLGEKIFVYADHKNLNTIKGIESVLPIFLSLRRRSNARMLWVCPADNNEQTKGSVREVIPGLAMGHLDIVAPPVLVGGGITVSGWLTVLCNAARVFNLSIN